MLCRCQQHVLEAAEHMGPDYLALVTTGKRRDENPGAERNAEMIRPERDETFDKRPGGRHSLGECRAALRGRDAGERATRLLPSLPSLKIVTLRRRPERANRIG